MSATPRLLSNSTNVSPSKKPLAKLVAEHNLAVMREQRDEDLEGLLLQPDRRALSQKSPVVGVHFNGRSGRSPNDSHRRNRTIAGNGSGTQRSTQGSRRPSPRLVRGRN